MSLQVGARGRAQCVVTEENTAAAVGSGLLPVFATPQMIALMENAAVNAVQAGLNEGEGTVGTHLDVSHDAATPVGMKVTATARLRSIERRKMWFDIEVHDEKGKCGEGSHLRIMVAPKGIQEKAEGKQA